MQKKDTYPLVSVIIPNYNHMPYLEERIESVLNQTYKNFEVIILDDHSSDNSQDVIEKYRNHPNVSSIVYNDMNSGSTFIQWNKGFNLSKGDYIWIAESDDVANVNFLHKVMTEMIKDKEIVLGFSDLEAIDSVGNKLSGYTRSTYAKNKIIEGNDFIKKNMIFGCHIINASCAVFRRDALEAISRDYIKLKSAGDYMFWIEVAKQGKIVKIPEVLDLFRQHNSKVTPKAERCGLMYIEANQIFKQLKAMGYIDNKLSALACIGFWLQRIELSRKKFESENIYKQVSKIWKDSSQFSSLSKIIFYTNGLFRRITRIYHGYYL